MNKIEMLTKTSIKKNTEYTEFLEIVTITEENTAMIEKK